MKVWEKKCQFESNLSVVVKKSTNTNMTLNVRIDNHYLPATIPANVDFSFVLVVVF